MLKRLKTLLRIFFDVATVNEFEYTKFKYHPAKQPGNGVVVDTDESVRLLLYFQRGWIIANRWRDT